MSEIWIAVWESGDFRFVLGLLAGCVVTTIGQLVVRVAQTLRAPERKTPC